MWKLALSLFAILCPANLAAADSELLHECLRPGEKKAVCAAYLAGLMRDLRFGTPISAPFCLPKRDLTAEEHNLVFTKFWADNQQLQQFNAMMLSAVVATKAARCP
jgi:hypothetical protein